MRHSTVSRRGGRASSEAKTLANRAKMAAYWDKVRSGELAPPRRYKKPPSPERIAEILSPYCRKKGITRLQVFGSVSRGEARQGSDVDLIVTFAPGKEPRGLDFFCLPDEVEALLGVPVDIVTPDTLAELTNPYRKNAIISEARDILTL